MRPYASRFLSVSRQYIWLYVGMILHISIAWAMTRMGYLTPYDQAGRFYVRMALHILSILVTLYMLFTVVRLMRAGHPTPVRALIHKLRDVLVAHDRFVHAPHVLFISILTIRTFAMIKSSIPSVHSFSWDAQFLAADRLLFGGYDAYQWTQVLFGNVPALIVLNFFYNLWLIVVVAAIVACALVSDNFLRMRYLIAMFLSWVIAGNLLAIMFSSAGPCFLARLVGDHTFDPLMAGLQKAHEQSGMIWALFAQDALWAAYVRLGGDISGISAMPSLHVVFAVLIYLALRDRGSIARYASMAFAIVICVGSVQLGWHYAVDGMAGVLLALAFWKIAGVVARLLLGAPGYQPATARAG